jgi:hypothetical protein
MGELATWSVVIVLAPAALLGVLWLGWKLLPYVAALGWGLVALFTLSRPDRPGEVGFVAAFLALVALMWIGKRWYRR